MKFLPPEMVRRNMIPLNIIYHVPSNYKEADSLTIIYKDLDSGQKLVYEVERPQIEIFIVKPEYRTFTNMRDWLEKGQCARHTVRYRNRWNYCVKELGLKDYHDAKRCRFIFGADIPIETYYLMQFIKEYPTDAPKTLSLGLLDIENDIIQCEGFPSYGETPINAVTYVNVETNDVYTLVLFKDNLPRLPEHHPKYNHIQSLKTGFYDQVASLRSNMNGFVAKCHEKFDPLYGDLNYNILTYDEEEVLLQDLMTIIHSTDNDFISIWNLPYDIGNIIKRPSMLGMDPNALICDDRFANKTIHFREDTNPVTHKRRHKCVTSTIPTFVDDMVHYAGIRSVGGKLPSTKLNYVAQRELGDEKYDYSEVSNLKYLFYKDLEKFILYNIKDVLLMLGITRKTKDMENIYSRLYQMFVFPNEAFITTKVVWYSLVDFIDKRGFTFGTNRNKGNKTKKILDYAALLTGSDDYKSLVEKAETLLGEDDDDDQFIDLFIGDDDEEVEYDENGDPIERDDKFAGAFVMNTLHMLTTGFKVMGKESKYIHENVADLDVESEYPTAINTCNISNETIVGKVYLENPEAIDAPIPEGFVFKGDDELKYKMDVSNFMMESYTEGDVISFANRFLGLPSMMEILKDVDDIVNK